MCFSLYLEHIACPHGTTQYSASATEWRDIFVLPQNGNGGVSPAAQNSKT
jgi:hypothetical protein